MAQILALERGARIAIIDVNMVDFTFSIVLKTSVNHLRLQSGAQETVESIVSKGGQATAYFCDITNNDALQEIANKIGSDHGQSFVIIYHFTSFSTSSCIVIYLTSSVLFIIFHNLLLHYFLYLITIVIIFTFSLFSFFTSFF